MSDLERYLIIKNIALFCFHFILFFSLVRKYFVTNKIFIKKNNSLEKWIWGINRGSRKTILRK